MIYMRGYHHPDPEILYLPEKIHYIYIYIDLNIYQYDIQTQPGLSIRVRAPVEIDPLI